MLIVFWDEFLGSVAIETLDCLLVRVVLKLEFIICNFVLLLARIVIYVGAVGCAVLLVSPEGVVLGPEGLVYF